MSKTLIIAEKPSVGSDIARVLGSRSRTKGYIDGEKYVITWAIGHLISLCSPEEMDESLKEWSFDTLPILPTQMKLKVLPRTRQQYETIRYLARREDISDIICATDSGREGELIFRYIYGMIGTNKPFRRLWISSMTDEAIRDGFSALRPGSDYDDLYKSAKCRAEADWLVGMNASRGYTLQYDRLLSVGRVQSPTLALMVRREHEIEAFVPVPYLEINVSFGSYKGRYMDPSLEGEERFRIDPAKREWGEKLCERLKGTKGRVERVERKQVTLRPQSLYDLTQLQRDANRRLGWTAAKTLETAQALYEKYKLITYPRTDSRYLSKDINKTLHSRLEKLRVEPYARFIDDAINSTRKLFGPVINDAGVSDHHAIIPTGRDPSKVKLPEDEAALFDLIARRFISVFYPDELCEDVQVYTRAADELIYSSGRTVLEKGFSVLYDDIEIKKKGSAAQQSLSDIKEGDEHTVRSAKLDDKQTQPPSRYTEAMLLNAMEHAGRAIEDEDLREQMKDSGLGTPATRASIIERLIQVAYVKRRGKLLVPTQKGIAFVSVLPATLSSAEMTGRWEKGLAEIGRGEKDAESFMQDIRAFVSEIVEASRHRVDGIEFPKDARQVRDENDPPPEKVPLGKCPLCDDGEVLENRKAFYCTNWRRNGARCRLTIWKNALEKQQGPMLDAEMIKQLLQSGIISGDYGNIKLTGKQAPYILYEKKGDEQK